MDARTKKLLKSLAAKSTTAEDPLKTWCPEEPTTKQLEFYANDNYEVGYGGSAGGGKSSALLMAALKFVHVPGYNALILRRTFTELSLPNAILDRARQWWVPKGISYQDRDKIFTFPSGAKIQFGFAANYQDCMRYQGSELHYLAWDEATQIDERTYLYLHSRVRKTRNVDIPLRIRSATNPGGPGHKFYYNRFVNPETRGTRVFIPAKLDDNPHLDKEEYLRALSNLDPVTRAQLERGEWIEGGEGRMYAYETPRNVFVPTSMPDRFVLGIDLGASQKTPSTAFTVLGFWSYNCKDIVVLESYKKAGMTPSSIAEEIYALQEKYAFERLVADAGALGKGYVEEFRQRWHLPVEAAQKSNRLGYVKLLNGDLQNGIVKVDVNNSLQLVDEWLNVQWNAQGTDSADGSEDHCSDATLYAWREAKAWLAQHQETKPKLGSEEYYKREEERMFEAATATKDDWE